MARVTVRARFWIECVSSVVALVLSVLTLVWRDWIEILFAVDPDGHSGAVEVAVALVAAAIALVAAAMARTEWRRALAVEG